MVPRLFLTLLLLLIPASNCWAGVSFGLEWQNEPIPTQMEVDGETPSYDGVDTIPCGLGQTVGNVGSTQLLALKTDLLLCLDCELGLPFFDSWRCNDQTGVPSSILKVPIFERK